MSNNNTTQGLLPCPRGQPAEILDRGEKIALVPFLIMQGALDDNVLPRHMPVT